MEHFNIKFIPPMPGIYLVGGCVRDNRLGRPCKDIDIAVNGDPAWVAARIAQAADTHAPFRIGKGEKSILRVVSGQCIFDVIRQNGASIEEDLLQRDFTVNAMAVEASTGRMIDPADGNSDIKSGIIRHVSKNALKNDPLRMLRAFRIGAELGFSICDKTLESISTSAGLINKSAGERIREEWKRFLSIPGSFKYFVRMEASGLAGEIFPELEALKGCNQNRYHRYDAFIHSMATYRQMEKMLDAELPPIFTPHSNASQINDPALIKHAALFHDMGKPAAKQTDSYGNIHFYGHEKKGAELSRKILDRLCFSNKDKSYIDFLISNHLKPMALFTAYCRGNVSRRAATRFFIRHEPWVPDLLAVSTADMMAKGFNKKAEKYLGFVRELLRRRRDEYLPAMSEKRLITGHDLVHFFSLEPSPIFKRILEHVDIKQRAGLINSKEEAIREAGVFLERLDRSLTTG